MSQDHGVVVGIDIGGTFTDLVYLDQGEIRVHKTPTTPADPAMGLVRGLGDAGAAPTAAVVHATTIATNALLERKGARTGLITTEGFRDVLEIGRQNRPHLYDFLHERPKPLVPRFRRYEVTERVAKDGAVLRPLDLDQVRRLLDEAAKAGVESLAVCLLFSFANPEHEDQIVFEARTRGLHACASGEVLPEFREFERTSTTVINAYVTPIVSGYLSSLEPQLEGRTLTVMQSNGGIVSAKAARERAIGMALSGPAAGVVGARYVAQRAGVERFIGFDVGGTSTDVSLCDRDLKMTTESSIGGHPFRLPVIDVHTVGAGGGSIARLDRAGALLVGPQSAGADPGPACYGKGDDPTLTDANLVLGRLSPDHFLGGEFALQPARSESSLAKLAGKAGVSAEEVARGMLAVAIANVGRAIKNISVDRGHDPRDFTLLAFGGAGPMMAAELAASLGMRRVLVPGHPGVLSALGLLVAGVSKSRLRTVMRDLDGTAPDELEQLYRPLEARLTEEMQAEGLTEDQVTIERQVDMRYRGQSYELTVTPPILTRREIAAAFDGAHERVHGYARRDERREIVTLRAVARAAGRTLPAHSVPGPPGRAEDALIGKQNVDFGRAVGTALYDKERLEPASFFDGPALVLQYDTTTIVPPGWICRVDRSRNLVLEAK